MPERTMLESPGASDTGHASGALLDHLEMEEIGADEGTSNARNIGDRRRLAWSKDQRKDRRHRRGHQVG